MRNILFSFLFMLFFVSTAFCARNFIEGVDYFVDFQEKDETMAAVLHINFVDLQPTPEEAEKLLKDQLKKYSKDIQKKQAQIRKEKEKQKKSKPKTKAAATAKEAIQKDEEEEIKYKNIIGSVWHHSDEVPKDPDNTENLVKVKFQEDSSAFVWLEKTNRIVTFPNYIAFLKKERDDKRDKERAKALEERRLLQLQQEAESQENIE